MEEKLINFNIEEPILEIDIPLLNVNILVDGGLEGKQGKDGIPGKSGEKGKEIELRKLNNYIQWRYIGDDWVNLIAIADLKGDTGKKGDIGLPGINGYNGKDGLKIELRKNSTHIEWRYEGLAWENLISLSDLKGNTGDPGKKGDTGNTGSVGPSNVLTIGSVTKGDNANATITGTSPNQVLNLVLPKGDPGKKGDIGRDGPPGEGLPVGGTIGQVLHKKSNVNYDYEWINPIPVGVASVNNKTGNVVIDGNDINVLTTEVEGKLNLVLGLLFQQIMNLQEDKQDKLVSSNNIKTVNGASILGSGNISTPNTTYSEITESEIISGTSSSQKSLTGRRVKKIIDVARENVVLGNANSNKIVSGIFIGTTAEYESLSDKTGILAILSD